MWANASTQFVYYIIYIMPLQWLCVPLRGFGCRVLFLMFEGNDTFNTLIIFPKAYPPTVVLMFTCNLWCYSSLPTSSGQSTVSSPHSGRWFPPRCLSHWVAGGLCRWREITGPLTQPNYRPTDWLTAWSQRGVPVSWKCWTESIHMYSRGLNYNTNLKENKTLWDGDEPL